jgi:hypothetical protein
MSEERRGEDDCRWFLEQMLDRLNDPKNVAKGPYEDMTVSDIRAKLKEEFDEADFEMRLHGTTSFNKTLAISELADLAVVCMIGAVKARTL